MTKEQKQLLKSLLSSEIQQCKINLKNIEISDTYNGTNQLVNVNKRMLMIEQIYKELEND
jgi:hypothetical protein